MRQKRGSTKNLKQDLCKLKVLVSKLTFIFVTVISNILIDCSCFRRKRKRNMKYTYSEHDDTSDYIPDPPEPVKKPM